MKSFTPFLFALLASAVTAASVPRETVPRICDVVDDCCFNDVAACENQGFGEDYCKGETATAKMCERFRTTAGTVPSCDGADCCVISTGLGGACDAWRHPKPSAAASDPACPASTPPAKP